MATKVWDDDQKQLVANLLTAFNGGEEICASLDCKPSELDRLCKAAFGEPFEAFKARCASIGRAKLKSSLMKAALDGNAKALDMLAREQLGMDPVAARRSGGKNAQPAQKETLVL